MTKQNRVRVELEKKSVEIFRALLALNDAGTMIAAAKQLGMSLSTLSRHLQKFHLGRHGRTLLVQEGRSWALTPRGRTVLPAIRELVRDYEQLLEFLANDAESPTVVRIGMGNFSAQHYFPQAMIAAREQSEQRGMPLLVESETTRGRDRVLGVHDGLLDLSIVTHTPEQIIAILRETRRPYSPLDVEQLAQHPFCVVARSDSRAGQILAEYPAAGRLPLKELARVELVGLDAHSGIRRRLEQQFRTAKREPLFVPGTGAGGWQAAKEFARLGVGAAVLPLGMIFESDQGDLILRHLPTDIMLDEYLIHRPPLTGTTAPRAVLDLIAALRIAASEFRRQTVQRWSVKK